MFKRKTLSALIGVALASASTVALAQSTAQNANSQSGQNQPQQMKTITVTGSALPRIDIETPSPVTTISAAQIRASGLTTVADVVRAVSADNSGSIPTSFTAGFAAGSSGVALRGLTVNSTLVLINGQRVANYAMADDGERTFVDLNSIPITAIQRIEVLKDGASSLYGADAIAGVVNIIMRKSYKGAQASVQIGNSQHGGGFEKRASIMAGAGDLEKDGHNAFFSAEFESDNAIAASQRGFPYNTSDLSSIGGNNGDNGNPAAPSGSPYGTVQPATETVPGNILSGQAIPGSQYQTLRPCGSDTTAVTSAAGTYCEYDQARLFGQIQPKVKRAGFYGRFTQQLSDNTRAHVDVMYAQTKVVSSGGWPQINSTVPNNTNSIVLPAVLNDGSLNPNDPFAAQGQDALINFAFPNLYRDSTEANHNLRFTGGVTTHFGGWNIDTGVVVNHTWLDTNNQGFLNYNQLISDIQNGTYNFVDPSQNSPAVLKALAPDLTKTSTTNLDSLHIQGTTELADLQGGELGLAIGAQWRYESQNDPALNPGGAAQGLGNAVTIGRRNVSSLYAELDAPVLESLELDLSGRYDHYSDFGNNFSPKFGIKWQPIDSLALRGTFSKGFRAPSFSENGSSSVEGFVTEQLPQSFIAAHGGSSNGYNLPYSIAEYTTANPNIKPEKSTSYTFGAVFQPTDSLSASLDYYHIKKTNVITGPDTASALSNYFAGLPQNPGTVVTPDQADPKYPNALPRPIVISAPYQNAESLKTSGVDLDVQGTFHLGPSVKWVSEISMTKILKFQLTTADGTKQDYVGTEGPYNLSSGAGTPRYRGHWRNSFSFGRATITGTLYYTSGLKLTIPDLAPPTFCYAQAADGSPLLANCHMSSFTDFDLTGSYWLTDNLQLTASVLNAFDRKAPFDPIDYAANNYNPTWAQQGAVGRFYTVGLRVKFK